MKKSVLNVMMPWEISDKAIVDSKQLMSEMQAKNEQIRDLNNAENSNMNTNFDAKLSKQEMDGQQRQQTENSNENDEDQQHWMNERKIKLKRVIVEKFRHNYVHILFFQQHCKYKKKNLKM